MYVPLVSVVIPSHNYGHMIEETLWSVFNQTYPNVEVIVVDDDSTDNTREVIQKYPQVTYYFIKHEGAKTPAHAHNFGLTVTHGKFMIFLGADDKLLPSYIEKCYNKYVFETTINKRRVGLVWTACQEFEASHNIRSPRLTLAHTPWDFVRNPGGQLGAMFVPKQVYDKVGGYDESLVLSEDWDFAIRVLQHGYQAISIPEPLHLCRIHSLNINHVANLNRQCFTQLRKKHRVSFTLYFTAQLIKDRTVLLYTDPKLFLRKLKLRSKRTLKYFARPKLQTLCVEPTNDCNLCCKMCIFHTRPIGYMTITMYSQILSEASKLNPKPQTLHLNYAGESFKHPQIGRMLELALDSGIPTRQLFTNGMLVEPYLETIARCLTHITFSLDGIGKVNDNIRIGCNYDLVLSNIKKLIAIRRQIGSKIEINVNATRTTQTEEELQEFKREMLKLVDHVFIDFYRDRDNRYASKYNGVISTEKNCPFPLNSLVILWDGQATFCMCSGAYPPIFDKLTSQSLEQLWNGKALKQIQKETLSSLSHPDFIVCEKCERWKENRLQEQKPSD